MNNNNEKVKALANIFSLPVIDDTVQVWFFRTQSGVYYDDFRFNKYIALGWDLVSKDMIVDTVLHKDNKRERISEIYPDEQRPGLILGQMDTFYNKMQAGDLVVIPSNGGKFISIGTLGDIITSVNHSSTDENMRFVRISISVVLHGLSELTYMPTFILRKYYAHSKPSQILVYAQIWSIDISTPVMYPISLFILCCERPQVQISIYKII